MLEFNGHEMSNESNLEWTGEKSIIGQELQKVFAPKVESKDEILIEEKSILTQELILEGYEMPCEVNLGKNDFSIENNDQLAKDKEFRDEKFTNDLTQELKLMGQQMSYDFILGEWQENAKESI